VDWFHLAEDNVHCRTSVNMVMNLRVLLKAALSLRAFRHHRRHYQLLWIMPFDFFQFIITSQIINLFGTSDQPVTRPVPTQDSTRNKDEGKHPCLERDSNPRTPVFSRPRPMPDTAHVHRDRDERLYSWNKQTCFLSGYNWTRTYRERQFCPFSHYSHCRLA
jgi:hypothetical protein